MTLALVKEHPSTEQGEDALNAVFFALADPVRRAVLKRLDDGPALVSELAEPFEMSLQAVSRHIQVLVRAGLVTQERTGRIARCRLDAGPLYGAAVWLNRYTKYWQHSFEALTEIIKALPPSGKPHGKKASTKGISAKKAKRR